jgi:hypothetical protein
MKNQCGQYVTKDNADLFATCAVVGTGGSGHEEGLESVRRALDPQYPIGPWNSSAAASPLNAGFLRDDADLQIVYVSDEEDQPNADQTKDGAVPWSGQSGVTADDVTKLRAEEAADLADGGREFNTKYAFIPFVENYVTFLKGLKPAGGPKVRAHAIVTTLLDESDDCHTRSSTEEVGQRYIAVANLMGGSANDVCASWASTMDDLGVQATGRDSCFALESVPTVRSSISATVGGDPASVTYVATGNRVCFKPIPAAGADIVVTYH